MIVSILSQSAVTNHSALQTVFRDFSAHVLPVLSRWIRPPFKAAFVAVTTCAFQKELFALSAAEFTVRVPISCHPAFLYFLFSFTGPGFQSMTCLSCETTMLRHLCDGNQIIFSDSSPFGRTAAVMRYRSDITDQGHFNPGR